LIPGDDEAPASSELVGEEGFGAEGDSSDTGGGAGNVGADADFTGSRLAASSGSGVIFFFATLPGNRPTRMGCFLVYTNLVAAGGVRAALGPHWMATGARGGPVGGGGGFALAASSSCCLKNRGETMQSVIS
jgi:hypothetical protein